MMFKSYRFDFLRVTLLLNMQKLTPSISQRTLRTDFFMLDLEPNVEMCCKVRPFDIFQ